MNTKFVYLGANLAQLLITTKKMHIFLRIF